MKDIYFPAEEASLRVHGNGFVQAETREGSKLHIWDKRVPSQKVSTPIHNHQHGFMSQVNIGGLRMIEYTLWVSSTPDWQPPGYPGPVTRYVPHKCVVRKDKDTTLEPIGPHVALMPGRRFWMPAGSAYDFPLNMHLFHLIDPMWAHGEMVISTIQRTTPAGDILPTVLVKYNDKPDNEFNRYGHYDIAKEVYEDAITLLLALPCK